MDVLSRDFLFYCSDTLSMGMGFGIAAVTLAIKLVYFPTTIKVMLDAEKMKLL
jgi:membrane protein insertase Oxa1/YidC/SpoIIIJ